MISRTFAKFLLVLLACGVTISVASAKEPFYWKSSYGRGGGVTPGADCGCGEYDWGLCYPKCSSGYHGVGPVCWEGAKSYGRGVGTPPKYGCGDKEEDAGLCYSRCKSGYKGVGPVCWETTPPPGYVDCGAGFAKDSGTCAEVTSAQVIAAGMLAAAAIPAAQEAANAKKQAEIGAEGVEEAGKLSKLLDSLMDELRPLFDEMAKGAKPFAEGMARAKTKVLEVLSKDPEQAEQIFQAMKYFGKYSWGAGSSIRQALNSPEGVFDFLRLATTITGIMDPTPVSGLISAYAYPVYEPSASNAPRAPAAPAVSVVSDWDYLYAVSEGSLLYYYRLDAGGAIGARGQIGSGWGGMRIVTAGDHGELYAVDGSGNLYFYKHDTNMRWKVEGVKIGFGFNSAFGYGGLKTLFAAGNFHSYVEHRVLFALDNRGTLWYYKFGEAPDGSIETPVGVQVGWGWNACSKVFAGAGGVVYCIRGNGDLYRYAYDLQNPRRTPGAQKVGSSWGGFTRVFGGSNGLVFAVEPNGTLLAYHDPGTGGWLSGPQQIGTGWNLPQVTAMKSWPTPSAQQCALPSALPKLAEALLELGLK